MKKLLVIALCLLTLACSKTIEGGSTSNSNSQENKSDSSQAQTGTNPTLTGGQTGEAITFNIVQPLGQKSNYDTKMVFKIDADNPTPGQPPMSIVMNMGMGLETDVIAANPDGTWTVTSKISNVKMEGKMGDRPMPIPPDSTKMEGKTYTVTYDKNGKVVKLDGTTGAQAEQNVKEMLENINPTDMLPPKSVKVGDSWPVNLDMPMPASGGPAQAVTAKGTGRLIEVSNGQATLDYDFTIDMTGQVSGTGTGKSTMKYDLQKSRVIYNTMDMNFDVSGREGTRTMKAKMNMNMSIDLVNK